MQFANFEKATSLAEFAKELFDPASMTSLSESADSLILGLEKAEADLQAIAHRLEEGFELQYGRHQV